MRNERNINVKKPVFLIVGCAKNKNICRMLEAIKDIPCSLKIIGKPNEIQKKILKKYNIEYTSYTGLSNNEMVEQYNQCDVLLFASTYEGFGMPILEAQAVGRPVITSNISSMPEVAGTGAQYVDPYDVESIKYAVLMIIENAELREKIVRAGFENIKRFDPKKIALKYLKLYNLVFYNNR